MISWYSAEAMEWIFTRILSREYHTDLYTARSSGYPFTFHELADMMLHQFSPPH
jgi:hypothetical protein